MYISRTKKGIGSRPDPFGAGAYNLQSIAPCDEKGLVHETNCTPDQTRKTSANV